MHRLCATFLLVGSVLAGFQARADAIVDVLAEVRDITTRSNELNATYLNESHRGDVSERFVDGESYFRMGDYQRAAIIFMDVIENYSDTPLYGQAMFYYADSLFRSRDYIGARKWFKKVLDEHGSSQNVQYSQKAIGRLIEIAIHLGEYEGVGEYFELLGRAPSAEATYIKGKYLYFRGDVEQGEEQNRLFGEGLSIFESLTNSGDEMLDLKAKYLRGVILTRLGRMDNAIALFDSAKEQVGKTTEEQEILDLMHLAAGRLYFEQNFVEHASECYQRVNNNSPYFDMALFEAASVLILSGDAIRAERILEVLTIAVPDSIYIPRAKMLRGNLLLRTGRYDEAEKVFEEISNEYTPVMSKLDKLMAEQHDSRRFFSEMLARSKVSLDVAGILPPMIVRWVGEEKDVEHALELAVDLGMAQESVQDTERLIRLLEAVIDGPSQVNAVPILRQAKRRSQQMDNRLTQLRGKLFKISQKRLGEDNQIKSLMAERKALQAKLDALPINDEEFLTREDKARQKYDDMRKELARNAVRLDQMSAMVVAIERFIADPRYSEGVSSKDIGMVTAELKRHREAVVRMQDEMSQLRVDVTGVRYQVGVGDSADHDDDVLCAQIKDIAKRERALLGSHGAVGRRLEEVFFAIDKAEAVLHRFEQEVDAEAAKQVNDMRKLVADERDMVAEYRVQLRSLNDEAEEVVGDVTFDNFSNVKQRFHKLILQADVGIIDVAWLRKEEHRSRREEINKQWRDGLKELQNDFQEVTKKEETPKEDEE